MDGYIDGRIYPTQNPASAPARYGDYAPTPKVHKIFLDNALTNDRMGLGGAFIWAYRASSKDASCGLKFNSQMCDAIYFSEGMSIAGYRFSDVYVTCEAQAGEWIEFLVVHEGSQEQLKTLNPASQLAEVDISKATSLVTVADTTIVAAAGAVNVCAANAGRREVILNNISTSAGGIRVGDINTGAARGTEVNIGESIILTTTDDIYVYSAAGATIAISYIED